MYYFGKSNDFDGGVRVGPKSVFVPKSVLVLLGPILTWESHDGTNTDAGTWDQY